MPLENAPVGSPGFSRNVATEVKAGKPQKQAVAIAYSKARGDAVKSEEENRRYINSPEGMKRQREAQQRMGEKEGYPKGWVAPRKDAARADVSLHTQLHDALEDLDAAMESGNKKRIENAKADIEYIKKQMARKVAEGGNPRKDSAIKEPDDKEFAAHQRAVQRLNSQRLETLRTRTSPRADGKPGKAGSGNATVREIALAYDEGYENGRTGGNPADGVRLYQKGSEFHEAWKRGRNVGMKRYGMADAADPREREYDEAYQKGRKAGIASKPKSSNPGKTDVERRGWKAGWEDGTEERGWGSRFDAAPIDVLRNELHELERRMGSADPATQSRMRLRMQLLKDKIRTAGERSGKSGSERRYNGPSPSWVEDCSMASIMDAAAALHQRADAAAAPAYANQPHHGKGPGPAAARGEAEKAKIARTRGDAASDKLQAAYERGQRAGKADRSAPLGARGRSMSGWVAFSELKGEEKEAWVRGYRSV